MYRAFASIASHRRSQGALALVTSVLLMGGCMVKETRPLPKINPVQAQAEIPVAELLDVGVRVFDPGIPEAIANDTEELTERGIFPDVRRAEARHMATLLRDTLEGSGQWGAVRVIPATAEFVDVMVAGKILKSNGRELELEVGVRDSTGRVWIAPKRYASPADVGSYLSEAAIRLRDPFQNVYSQITNDILAARKLLTSNDLVNIRRITEIRFAADLAPQSMSGYLVQDAKGQYQVTRLPAEGDPVLERIQAIRERDGALIDTVSDYYGNFSQRLDEPYDNWRRYSYEEIVKEEKLKSQARTRMVMGAAAILGGVFIPSQCGVNDYNCRRIENAGRTAATVGGIAGILSGLKKSADAKVHTTAIRELANSFQGEVAPQVVEVEGRTLKLTGTAEEQYRQWRDLLREQYTQETGGVSAAQAPTTDPAATAAPSATTEPAATAEQAATTEQASPTEQAATTDASAATNASTAATPR